MSHSMMVMSRLAGSPSLALRTSSASLVTSSSIACSILAITRRMHQEGKRFENPTDGRRKRSRTSTRPGTFRTRKTQAVLRKPLLSRFHHVVVTVTVYAFCYVAEDVEGGVGDTHVPTKGYARAVFLLVEQGFEDAA